MHTIDGPTAPLPPRTPAHQKPTGLWLATSLWRAARAWPLLAGVLCVGVLPPAFAQAIDPPGRVARLNLVEGAVSFAPADAAGGAGWTPAVRNRPLTEGDRIWTAPGSRSEIHIGALTLRLGEQTSVDFLALDDDATRLRLAQGSVRLRVRSLYPGQQLEVSTPNLTFGIAQAGDYRIDADPAGDTTRVQVHSGGGTAYGDAGTALELSRNQQATFTGTQLAAGNAPQGSDGFDRWADARDQLEERSVAARYVPREVVGYQQLDAYGDWQQDADYGPVWLPRAVPMNWAPYRVGHWSWIAPWGWTWIDDAPWGFAPSHYGRWTQIGPRWAWAPGRIAPRPVYAPALVAFIGGTAGGATWNVAIGPGRPPQPAFGWFPLAPGEAFRPAYRVSPRYVGSVNQNLVVHRVPGDAARGHRYQRHEGAVSVARADDFIGGRPIRALPQAVQAADLRRGRIAFEETALPPRPERYGSFNPPRPSAPGALPPAALAAQPVPGRRDFVRDRTPPAEPGTARNADVNRPPPPGIALPGLPPAPMRATDRSGPQDQPGKRDSGERRQAAQAEQRRIAEPPFVQQAAPPQQPTPRVEAAPQQSGERRQTDGVRGLQGAPSPQRPPGDDERGRHSARDPQPSPSPAPRFERPAQAPWPDQQAMQRQQEQQQQLARQAQQAQQVQRVQQQQQQQQQQTARQADQDRQNRQDQQRAHQAQQQAQQQAQRQQEQTRQPPPPQAAPAPQIAPPQPVPTRPPQADRRSDDRTDRNNERNNDRRQRGGPGADR